MPAENESTALSGCMFEGVGCVLQIYFGIGAFIGEGLALQQYGCGVIMAPSIMGFYALWYGFTWPFWLVGLTP